MYICIYIYIRLYLISFLSVNVFPFSALVLLYMDSLNSLLYFFLPPTFLPLCIDICMNRIPYYSLLLNLKYEIKREKNSEDETWLSEKPLRIDTSGWGVNFGALFH